MPLSRDEVENILKPYFDKLFITSTAGVKQYNENYPNRHVHTPRGRANIIHDLMIAEARRQFIDVPGVRIVPDASSQLTYFDFHEKVLVLFKKLDRGRSPRNYPTKHARKLLDGIHDLPNVPLRATLVIVGYTLNLEETKVLRVSIVRPNGIRIPEWHIDLEEPEPIAPTRPDLSAKDETPARRIRAKAVPIQTELALDEDELQPSDAHSRTRVTRAKSK